MWFPPAGAEMQRALSRRFRNLGARISSLPDQGLGGEELVDEIDSISVLLTRLRDDAELAWNDELDGGTDDAEGAGIDDDDEDEADDVVDELDGKLSFEDRADDDV